MIFRTTIQTQNVLGIVRIKPIKPTLDGSESRLIGISTTIIPVNVLTSLLLSIQFFDDQINQILRKRAVSWVTVIKFQLLS